jgi:hypothetical protein
MSQPQQQQTFRYTQKELKKIIKQQRNRKNG